MTAPRLLTAADRLRILDGEDQGDAPTNGRPGPLEVSEAELLAAASSRRARKGGSFILDAPDRPAAIWGRGGQVLWASGEPFILVGPTGVGKTTLGGQVVLARAGIGTGRVLGFPVEPGQRRTLYLASDRPQQIGRALRRLVTEDDRQQLDERLVCWPGPPPKDLAKMPDLLLAMAREFDSDTLILDSLKDVAIGLSSDEVGSAVNNAVQLCIANGVEVLAYHHQRKGQAGSKPRTLEDVYGSTWLTAGAGSVVLLWGAAGDPVVELVHLKQPSEEVGPLRIEHDHEAGTSTILGQFDPLRFLELKAGGATAIDVARAWFEAEKPTEAQRAKAKRACERLVREGMAKALTPTGKGGAGGTSAAVYRAVTTGLLGAP